MASLAISSFLYASLTTQVETVSKAAAVLLLYGVVFGPSVLAFFYALTLMTYQNPDTRGAAKAAYLVVVIVGPLVVLRFLAGAAQGAWNLRCSSSGSCAPENWSPPLIVAIAALILLLGISISVSEKRVFEEWPKLRWLCNWLCVRPVLPAFVIFVFSATVTVAGMLATEPISYVPPAYFIWVSLAAGFILLVCFALACGCVVGPRLDKPAPRFRGKYLSLTTFKCNGTDLASPVRFVTDEGKIFIVTDCAGSFKVEQIRLNPAVTVADCAASGRLRSSGVSARADVLSDDETQNLKRLMARKYRFERFRTRVLQVISRRHREEEQKIAVLVTLSS
jgi:PPOX class probable F420-dependent enzyme